MENEMMYAIAFNLTKQLRLDHSNWTSDPPSASTLTSSAERKQLQESFHGNCLRRGLAWYGRTAAVPPYLLPAPLSQPVTAWTERKYGSLNQPLRTFLVIKLINSNCSIA